MLGTKGEMYKIIKQLNILILIIYVHANNFSFQFASLLNYRIICNTSFTISNVIGPKEEFMIAGIPVTYIRTTSSSLAHAITMHMVSYAGKADMQILVAKDIIPYPEKLAKCFEDALLEMKEAALKIKGEKPNNFPENLA